MSTRFQTKLSRVSRVRTITDTGEEKGQVKCLLKFEHITPVDTKINGLQSLAYLSGLNN